MTYLSDSGKFFSYFKKVENHKKILKLYCKITLKN